ncbi:MAG TPA: class II aldolase/adducin family protein [Candidatus Baltobacteraceae bacterium]
MNIDEDRARSEIARYCRLLWDRRLVTGSSGNVSVRLDDGDLLVTPSGLSLRDLPEAAIVRVDAGGAPCSPAQRPTSELPLHLAAYGARPDARCIVHTHPTFCVVWSKVGSIFPRDTVGARETLGPVAWTAFREPGTRDLADLCAAEFARGFDTVVMERHGVSVVADSLERAFMLTDLAEEAARIAYYSRLAGLTE